MGGSGTDMSATSAVDGSLCSLGCLRRTLAWCVGDDVCAIASKPWPQNTQREGWDDGYQGTRVSAALKKVRVTPPPPPLSPPPPPPAPPPPPPPAPPPNYHHHPTPRPGDEARARKHPTVFFVVFFFFFLGGGLRRIVFSPRDAYVHFSPSENHGLFSAMQMSIFPGGLLRIMSFYPCTAYGPTLEWGGGASECVTTTIITTVSLHSTAIPPLGVSDM